MAKTKTKSEGEAAVVAHIAKVENPKRRKEAEDLNEIFQEITGFKPRLWAGRMIGYGQYDYTYESGHSGTWLATGFAVGARQLTFYILPGYTDFAEIMQRFGKHKHGKSCIYVSHLEDVDRDALRDLVQAGLKDLNALFPVQPT